MPRTLKCAAPLFRDAADFSRRCPRPRIMADCSTGRPAQPHTGKPLRLTGRAKSGFLGWKRPARSEERCPMREQPTQEQLMDNFASYVSPQKVRMYRLWGADFIPGRREGVRVWDYDGERSWIDCRCAGGVFNLGHRPPRVIAALREALDELDMSDHMLASGYRGLLAKRLADLTPGDLQYTTFGSSGGEE